MPRRVSEGLIVPEKPGNAGGGKEPWFQGATNVAGNGAIAMRLATPEKIQSLQRKLYLKAKQGHGASLEREPGPRAGCQIGTSGSMSGDGKRGLAPSTAHHRAHLRLY